ncbi:MAG: M50 family metallopeptidase [Rickettsiaceae bacterium]|nr:M50 family metallopeptidase [Rickettsiaceae bacterium]
MLSSVLGFLIVISIIIFVHELGHYIVARICGVDVEQFSLGFGPAIAGYRDSKGTYWKICVVPLGGYVKMFGDGDLGGFKANSKYLNRHERKRSYLYQKPSRRLFIALAGPLANYLLAITIFFGVYSYFGKVVALSVVSEVVANSPAEEAGLREGDVIQLIDSEVIENFQDIHSYVSLRPNTDMILTIKRGDEAPFSVSIKTGEREILDSNNKLIAKAGFIGIKSAIPEIVNLSPIEAAMESVKDVVLITEMTKDGLLQILTGKRSLDELRGTITVAKESGQTIQTGFVNFAIFIAMISINIGFVNLLPIPILDGGHVIICLYEMITGSTPNKIASQILTSIGIMCVLMLFLISTSNDLKAIM